MLPYRSTFTKTFSIGTSAYFAVASMIRMFAWCGMNRSMSSPVSPARSSAWSAASAMDRTAALKTSRPAIFTRWFRSSSTATSMGTRAPPAGRQSSSASVPSERVKLEIRPRPFSDRLTTAAPAPSPNRTAVDRSPQSTIELIFSVEITSAISARPDTRCPSAIDRA